MSPYVVTASTSTMVTASTTGTANPVLTGSYATRNVVTLLQSAYNFTATDLGSKNYFANGTINGSTAAVPPTGLTLPTANGLPGPTEQRLQHRLRRFEQHARPEPLWRARAPFR